MQLCNGYVWTFAYCYLNPRFRLQHLHDCDSTLEQIKAEAISLALTNPQSELSTEGTPPPVKKVKGLGAILKHALSHATAESLRQRLTMHV